MHVDLDAVRVASTSLRIRRGLEKEEDLFAVRVEDETDN
jgi:hypothetical protein